MEQTITTLTDEQSEELLGILKENDPKFNLTKLAEEAAEVALACLQKINKNATHAPTDKDLITEIAQTMLRMGVIIEQMDPTGEMLDEAMEAKLRYLYENKDKYRGSL